MLPPVGQAVAGFLFALLISVFSFRRGWLTRSGAAVQVVLGTLLFGLGGFQWAVPILLFFFLSSVLSGISGRLAPEAVRRAEKGGRRDGWQVLANGGVPGVLVIVWLFLGDPVFYAAYLGAVAVATADTWGTEAGIFSRRPPRLITSLAVVERGTSGGISVLGTSSGIFGALAVVSSGIPWLGSAPTVESVVPPLVGGAVGFLLDSVLGATIQAKFGCSVCGVAGENTVHCGVRTVRAGGIPWIRNDAVNAIAIAAGSGIVFLWLGP